MMALSWSVCNNCSLRPWLPNDIHAKLTGGSLPIFSMQRSMIRFKVASFSSKMILLVCVKGMFCCINPSKSIMIFFLICFNCFVEFERLMAFIKTAGLLPRIIVISCCERMPIIFELGVPSSVMHKWLTLCLSMVICAWLIDTLFR